jgi:hypothetical protein
MFSTTLEGHFFLPVGSEGKHFVCVKRRTEVQYCHVSSLLQLFAGLMEQQEKDITVGTRKIKSRITFSLSCTFILHL